MRSSRSITGHRTSTARSRSRPRGWRLGERPKQPKRPKRTDAARGGSHAAGEREQGTPPDPSAAPTGENRPSGRGSRRTPGGRARPGRSEKPPRGRPSASDDAERPVADESRGGGSEPPRSGFGFSRSGRDAGVSGRGQAGQPGRPRDREPGTTARGSAGGFRGRPDDRGFRPGTPSGEQSERPWRPRSGSPASGSGSGGPRRPGWQERPSGGPGRQGTRRFDDRGRGDERDRPFSAPRQEDRDRPRRDQTPGRSF